MACVGTSAMLLTYPIFTTLETVKSVPAAFGLVMACLIMVTGYSSINAIIFCSASPSAQCNGASSEIAAISFQLNSIGFSGMPPS